MRVSPCKQCEIQREVRFSRILAEVKSEIAQKTIAQKTVTQAVPLETQERFDSGAVRDKVDYRYDLMSPIVVKGYLVGEKHKTLAKMLLRLHEDIWQDGTALTLALDDVVASEYIEMQRGTVPHLYAQAMHEGALKYGDRNWEQGYSESNLVNHALYHLFNLDNKDEKHLSHLVWNVMTIIHFRDQTKT